MAKILRIGKKYVNLDNVNYIDLGKEDGSPVTVYFGNQTSLQFTGVEATQIWELLEEENFSGMSNPTN